MLTIPHIFYSIFIIIVSLVASLLLFLRIKKNHLLTTRPFFLHYALGFLISSLIHVPIFLIHLRIITISYNLLISLYAVSFLAILFSYLLFYRGTILLFTKDKFVTTIFPLIFLPLFATLTVALLFIFKVETILIMTAVVWGFLLPLSGYLGSLFFYSFIKGTPFNTMKRKFHALLLSFAWFLILILDIVIWLKTATYVHDFWVLKIAAAKGWFLARAIAYLLILVGVLLYAKYLQHPRTDEKT